MTVFVRQYDCIRMPLLLMLLLLHPVCVDCCASFWAPVMGPSPYRNVCDAACIALFDVIVCVALFVVCVDLGVCGPTFLILKQTSKISKLANVSNASKAANPRARSKQSAQSYVL